MKMKKFLPFFILTILFSSVLSTTVFSQDEGYEKYGRIAIAVVKEDYPDQEVIDYEYLGRKEIGEKQLEDTFRFELTKENKPIFVHVTITHEIGKENQFTLKIEEQK